MSLTVELDENQLTGSIYEGGDVEESDEYCMSTRRNLVKDKEMIVDRVGGTESSR